MPVSQLHEIRILPGIAIARLGSSPNPMDNFNAVADGNGFRRLEPAESLIVNPDTGDITASVTPSSVRFRDTTGLIRPVCPFLELWGRFDDQDKLRPLTKQDLEDLRMSPNDVQWSITIAGLKIFRRTGDPADRITATRSAAELAGHKRLELEGRCKNFKTETDKVTMGWVQYIRPTNEFPEIRMRFTPPHGLVFGHREVPGVIPPDRAIYDSSKGRWDTHEDGAQPTNPTPRSRLSTSPGGIYARSAPDAMGNRSQLGYFDDVGDAILTASLPGLDSASARIAVGPPDFAPDSYPTRSISDELAQMVEGVMPDPVSADQVIDIVRRAVETMRLMNTKVGNQNFVFWVPERLLPVFNNPSYPNKPASVDYPEVRGLHESILDQLQGLKMPADHPDRVAAHAVLKRVSDILRDFDRAADYERNNMQRMPALMRDASSHMLTLTRRQINLIRLAVEQFRPVSPVPTDPVTALRTMIVAFSWAAALHGNITTDQGVALDTVFDDPDKVMEHLRNGRAQGTDAQQLGIKGDPLVVAGDPNASAIIKLVSKMDHAMNSQLTRYYAADGTTNGIEVLRNWISEL